MNTFFKCYKEKSIFKINCVTDYIMNVIHYVNSSFVLDCNLFPKMDLVLKTLIWRNFNVGLNVRSGNKG